MVKPLSNLKFLTLPPEIPAAGNNCDSRMSDERPIRFPNAQHHADIFRINRGEFNPTDRDPSGIRVDFEF